MVLQQHLITFLLIIASSALVQGLGHIDLSVGNLLFLPLGATLYVYLHFSQKMLISVMLANTVVGYFFWGNWFDNGLSGFFGHVVIGSLAPLIAIQAVKFLRLGQVQQGFWQRLFLLTLITTIFNTLGKFFSFMDVLIEAIDPLLFLGSFMLGDILGCLVFVYLGEKFLTPVLKQRNLITLRY